MATNSVTTGRRGPAVLDAMTKALPGDVRAGAERCAREFHARLANRDGGTATRTVLVAYGGGKDSSYTVAFVRMVQLVHRLRFGDTFTIRVITNRQPGMGAEVMANIARVYAALGMTDDSRCELLVRDGARIHPFSADRPPQRALVERYREDILMSGHRTAGSGRPTFCNSCNFDMVAAFGAGAIDGVDMIVTGDSEREQRMYQVWVRRLVNGVLPGQRWDTGFAGFQQAVAQLADLYFRDLYGDDPYGEDSYGGKGRAVAERRTLPVTGHPTFFLIYDYTSYSSRDHWSFLTEFLGFRFDEASFNFTESDCGNPLLMAHLRGLRLELVYGRPYAEGIREYLRFALNLMRRKDFPDDLIEEMRARYSGEKSIARMRERARQYAESTFGLHDDHLACMVFAPFVNGGEGLERYLRWRRGDLVDRIEEVRAVLAGGEPDAPPDASLDASLVGVLERDSGLSLPRLRHLFRAPSARTFDTLSGHGLLTDILRHDPHKETVETRRTPDAPPTYEFVTGR